MNIKIFATAACILAGLSANAQTIVRDTLPPALKRADKNDQKVAGNRTIEPLDLVNIACPAGVADPVKYILTLPGVAGGADGSSAYYVRGGNHGGNLQTLDGVPIFGSTHLLGLTSVYSPDIMQSAEFQAGGFTSEEGNLSSSILKISTKDGSFDKMTAKAEASNFLLGGYISTPLVEDRLSLSASLRFSPIQLEYGAFSTLIDDDFSFRMQKAAVYDVYAKLGYRIDSRKALSLSVFNSLDSYVFSQNERSEDSMNWGNFIALLNYDMRWGRKSQLTASASYNHFANSQGMVKLLDKTRNDLLIRSSIDELTLHVQAQSAINRNVGFQYGLRFRHARFNPGSAMIMETGGLFPKPSYPLTDNKSGTMTGTAHGQITIGDYSRSMLRMSMRLNYNSTEGFDPEFSALGRLRIYKGFGLEASYDRLVQYYHTLEGIPLGWSADMIVPSGKSMHPERTQQLYGGAFLDVGSHHISAGYYIKRLEGLVWYMDATKLFSSAMAGWMNGICIGGGTSRGLELAYERDGKVLDWRLSYTLSHTDRTFPDLNEGKPFHARFDRPHVVNASMTALVMSGRKMDVSVNGMFTFQSGQWETVPAGEWEDDNFITGRVTLSFYSGGINNWQFPPYVRFDLNAAMNLKDRRHPQEIGVGIYNLLNRHNPSMLSYDARTKEWMQISLLPIMPSLRYVIHF